MLSLLRTASEEKNCGKRAMTHVRAEITSGNEYISCGNEHQLRKRQISCGIEHNSGGKRTKLLIPLSIVLCLFVALFVPLSVSLLVITCLSSRYLFVSLLVSLSTSVSLVVVTCSSCSFLFVCLSGSLAVSVSVCLSVSFGCLAAVFLCQQLKRRIRISAHVSL